MLVAKLPGATYATAETKAGPRNSHTRAARARTARARTARVVALADRALVTRPRRRSALAHAQRRPARRDLDPPPVVLLGLRNADGQDAVGEVRLDLVGVG